jgi:hypothetical protein
MLRATAFLACDAVYFDNITLPLAAQLRKASSIGNEILPN